MLLAKIKEKIVGLTNYAICVPNEQEVMPETCSKCNYCATYPNAGLKNGICNDGHFFDNKLHRRHNGCPLIEVSDEVGKEILALYDQIRQNTHRIEELFNEAGSKD